MDTASETIRKSEARRKEIEQSLEDLKAAVKSISIIRPILIAGVFWIGGALMGALGAVIIFAPIFYLAKVIFGL